MMADSRMKPEDFRKLLIPLGTRISLVSGEGGDWKFDDRPMGILEKYVVAERLHRWNEADWKWDAAAVIVLDKPLKALEVNGKTEFLGIRLLLFHRSEVQSGTPIENHWDSNDPETIAFGILPNALIGDDPIPFDIWQPNCVLLEYFANVLVEIPENPTPLAQAYLFRKERKALIALLEEGTITQQKFDDTLKKLEQKYPCKYPHRP